MYEKVFITDSGQERIEERHYIGDFAVYTKITDSNDSCTHQTRYLHTDRLGSTAAISDANGVIIERTGYDPFGKVRDSAWITDRTLDNQIGSNLNGLDSRVTDRGFTGHEHIDSTGLIHMNGRAYDPQLGRFLSVDPFIQAPENSQSLNPYSYIMNNPLGGRDPSGYTACDENNRCDMSSMSSKDVDNITINKDGSIIVTDTEGNSYMVDGKAKVTKEASVGSHIKGYNVKGITLNGNVSIESVAEKNQAVSSISDQKKYITEVSENLTQEEKDLVDSLNARISDYHNAIVKAGDKEALEEFDRTDWFYDRNADEEIIVSGNLWAFAQAVPDKNSFPNVDLSSLSGYEHSNENRNYVVFDNNLITDVVKQDMTNLRGPSYHGFRFSKHVDSALLQVVIHEAGHTLPSNAYDVIEQRMIHNGNTLKYKIPVFKRTKGTLERDANQHIRDLEKYLPSWYKK